MSDDKVTPEMQAKAETDALKANSLASAREKAIMLAFASEQLGHNKLARLSVQKLVVEAWREAEDTEQLVAAEKVLAELTDISRLM